ncbi:AMP-binding protein [Gordonia pseudamarae]|uniref:AMP-binding protein n=1 Tax=Gordonia pseudamarae TaxID=2831662 RepID=A0ABX6IIA1_9ACTN|nr:MULTISPECIES: AMP-binding protein [Gordonia]MBD0021383.1 AMP-binding protein [Gordonia sp. (in: high G+C Gram-positive bacteria)]QHN26446.1 AMP-binding protein [Gordonia pseudamarae]QHN35341.1 AMP-binding protein [Gordonia pseudamarae]
METMLTPQLSAAYHDGGYWPDRVITDYLDDYARQTPDKTAFVDHRREITYAQLRDEVDRCALGLLELGVRPGDVVSFQIPNWIEWVVVHYAASRIGAVSNPLIPIYREREVAFMIRLAESKVLIIPETFRGFDYRAMYEDLSGALPSVQHTLVVGSSFDEFMDTPWEQRRDRAELGALRPDGDDVSLLIFTSGTTGEPKGVMHTHNTLVAANLPLPARLGITADTVFHIASTLAHLTGFLYGARLNVQNGATCVLQDVWDKERFVELVARHKINYTSGATPFLHDFISAHSLADNDLSSLRLFCCMGAPIPRAILEQARRSVPGMVVLGGWGQTENALVTLGVPGDPVEKIVGTDGCPWPGMEIRTVDADGEAGAPGTEGRLQVRGPSLFVGYLNRPDETRAAFSQDWFDTGDIGVIDADGYLKISGRTKDIVIRGGENIPVAFVENVFYENPRIESVAVIGLPDPRLQERACACVVLKPDERAAGFTFSEMQEYLAGKGLAKQYWPERLEVMDSLPTTPSGKIQKFQLRRKIGDDA